MQNTTWLPLTEAARGIFFAQHLDPANTCFNTAEVIECPETVDLQLVRESLTQIYRENEGFRVRLRLDDGVPQQQVIPLEEFLRLNPVLVEDQLEEYSAEENFETALPDPVASWARARNAEALDLEEGHTVRSSFVRYGGKIWILHTFHHVVADGFAAFNALGRLAALYRSASQGTSPILIKRASLADLLEADRSVESERRKHRDFWSANPPVNPRDPEEEDGVLTQDDTSWAGRRADAAPAAVRVSLPVSVETQQKLLDAGKMHGAAWPTVAIAATGTLLARMSGASRASFGVPQMNRMLPGDAGALATASAQTGCTAVNMLPISVPASGMGLEQMKQVKTQQERNQDYALARQETVEREAQAQSGRLFGAQINVVPFDAVLTLGQETATIHNISAGPVDDLTVCLRGMPGRGNLIYCEVDVNPHLYSREDAESLAQRLIDWLPRWADSVLGRYSTSELSIATPAELAQLEDFNSTYYPLDYATLLQRWRTRVKLSPDQPALLASSYGVAHENSGVFDLQLTYRELDDRAQEFATWLIGSGVEPGDVIGLRFERGIEQYIALYGLLYAGCIYCPVLPELPADRVALMCSEAQVKVLVNGPGTEKLTGLEEIATDVVSWNDCIGGVDIPQLWPGDSTSVSDPAYLLFTSGSTGKPKGVVVSHQALDNRLRWQQNQIPVGEGDRILHKTPISFDVHVWELYWPLQEGACVVIAAPEGHRTPDYLARTIVEQKITCLHFVPVMLALLAHTPSARSYLMNHSGNLKYLVCSGEALLPEHVTDSRELFGVSPLNLYGPTEAAIDVTFCDTRDYPEGAEIPIGRPVWNTRCSIVDTEGQPLPVGIAGELVLSGVQLAEGYINNPQAQNRAFGIDPATGARFYRTGDRALWLADGTIRYLGRTDFQVKISGQRLELGEIEAVISAVAGVKNAVVFAHKTGTEQTAVALAALIELDGADGAQVLEDARRSCAEKLPAYMVPSLWDTLSDFPLGTSGKIDRKALAKHRFTVEKTSDIPASLLEQTLAQIFARALGQPTFGSHQNFLLSGGSSLSVLEVIADIQRRTGRTVSFAQVFATPTPAGLAASIESGESTRSEYAPIFTLRTGKSNAAWVFLPPAGGLGWCYTPYLSVLPQDDAVMALQARQYSEPDADFPSSVDACAEEYLQRILDLGYEHIHLAGWSVGGTVAVVLAEKARLAGLSIGQVWVLDGYPAEQWKDLPAPDEQETLVALLRMAGINEPDEVLTLERTIDILQAEGAALGALSREHCETAFDSMRASAAMMRTTAAESYAGKVQLAYVEHPDQPYLSADGWKENCAELETLKLDGSHVTLVTSEGARTIAETFLS